MGMITSRSANQDFPVELDEKCATLSHNLVTLRVNPHFGKNQQGILKGEKVLRVIP